MLLPEKNFQMIKETGSEDNDDDDNDEFEESCSNYLRGNTVAKLKILWRNCFFEKRQFNLLFKRQIHFYD